MFDQPFTVGAGRAADAVEFLIANSSLAELTAPSRGLYGELAVPAPSHVSTGEGLLWELAKEIGGACGSGSLTECADRLDTRNLAAVHAAIGILLGVELLAPVPLGGVA